MIRLNWIKRSEKYLKYGAILSGGLAGVLGFALRWKSADFEGIRQDLLIANEASVWLTIPFFTALAGILTFFKTHFGSTNIWKSVTHLLEEYRKAVFEGRQGFDQEASHHNRVTLYKHVQIRLAPCVWPWNNWMIPVARTGHTTQTWRIPRFRAPAGDPDNAEGVAGQSFATNSTVRATRLPELSVNASDTSIKKYARKGFVTPKWIRRKLTRGGCNIRSLIGVPIEVDGKPWGAIVIDSRTPDEIIDDERLRGEEFKRLARLLSKLLEN